MCPGQQMITFVEETPVEKSESSIEGALPEPPEEIQDGWMRQGVPTSLLEVLKEEEDDEASMSSQGDELPVLMRSAALRCLSQLLQKATCSQAGWFKAAIMLDSYTTKTDFRADLLPATCACLMRIIQKHDYKASQSLDVAFLQHCTQELSAWLSAAGYSVPDMTDELLHKQEVHIITTLKWRVTRCCAEQWSLSFMMRFSLLAGPSWHRTLREVQMRILVLARALVMCQRASASLRHGCMCLGLLCLGMVEAGLISLDALRPSEIPLEDWTRMYVQSQPDGVAPTYKVQPQSSIQVLEMLQHSANATMPELKEATFRVSSALSISLQGIRDMQKRGDGLPRGAQVEEQHGV
eukprot:TRINITY_DN108781_c0_g1_i1.p1 TRINITY_DN108781_c0_g1~~TRINITY_DN108781_c0_g1_i1.p1  ORF type:complete len:352 (+),score=83.26 TRINITY_DN108781_c0_g1_i1:77-1132(+)